jgi:hypothetical protein
MDSVRKKLALDIAEKVTRSSERVRRATEDHSRILVECSERLVAAYRPGQTVTAYIREMAEAAGVQPNVFWELWRFGKASTDEDVRADLLTASTKQEMIARVRRDQRDKGEKPPPVADPVLTAVVGDNCELIARVCNIYAPEGSRIADVTWGRGYFWRDVDLTRYDFTKSDLQTVRSAAHDFRRLPRDKYPDATFDVVAFDPPYTVNPGKDGWCKKKYRTHTVQGYGPAQILDLYEAGLREAGRILKSGGTVWCKCQDSIEGGGRQSWNHIEIYDRARSLGFEAVDLFVLVTAEPPLSNWPRQIHARKNHSFLWIFQKMKAAKLKLAKTASNVRPIRKVG